MVGVSCGGVYLTYCFVRDSIEVLKAEGFIPDSYDKGYKTVRLFKGKLCEMHDFKDDDSQASDKEDENPDDSIFLNNNDDGADESTKLNHNFIDTFNNRKALNGVIAFKLVPQGIRILNSLVKIFLFLLSVICFVEYFVSISEFDRIKADMQLITYSSLRLANFQYILANIRDIQLHNDGLVVLPSDEYSALFADTKSIVSTTDTMSSYLQLNTNNPSTELANLLSGKTISIVLEGGTSQLSDLNQATSMMISKALSIINSDVS